MSKGNLERKNLENIILRRLRKLSTEEPNKREKQKLSKLRSDFLEQKKLSRLELLACQDSFCSQYI